MRADPRYDQIYRDKTPGETEEQFIQKYAGPIGSLGMAGEFTRAQTEAAATSGAGPAAQFERVSRTREVEIGSDYSQKLAQTLSKIGVG